MDWQILKIFLFIVFLINISSFFYTKFSFFPSFVLANSSDFDNNTQNYQNSLTIDEDLNELFEDFQNDNHEKDVDEELKTDFNEQDRLFSQEEITQAIRQNTDDFFKAIIESRHLGQPISSTNHDADADDEDSTIRISKRSVSPYEYQYSSIESNEARIPDHLLEGIWPLSSIVDVTQTSENLSPLVTPLCPTKGAVIDFQILKFNSLNYVLCLTRNQNNFTVRYGPVGSIHYSLDLPLKTIPEKLIAFTVYESRTEDILLLVLSQKRQPEDVGVIWFQINTANIAFYSSHLSNLYRLNIQNCFALPSAQIVVFHDVHVAQLKTFQFNNGHFDPSSITIPASPDLSIVYGYEESQASFIVLGFRNIDPHRNKPRDAEIYVWNNYQQRFIPSSSSGTAHSPVGLSDLACEDDVKDIKFFTIGHGQSREKFLVIVEPKYVIFYKKTVHRFIVFQRLALSNVREIEAFGNDKRQFVLSLVYESNNVQFIVYNSLVFRIAQTQRNLHILPREKFYLSQFDESMPVFQFFIGRQNRIQLFELTFYHDKSLLNAWKSNFDWCKARRQEALNLAKQTLFVEDRFSKAFFKTEAFHIKGSIIVPKFQYHKQRIEAQVYRYLPRNDEHSERAFLFDQNYFNTLNSLREELQKIDSQSDIQSDRLSDALLHSSPDEQHVDANFYFEKLRIHTHDSWKSGSLLSIETKQLNGHEVLTLYDDTIRLKSLPGTQLNFIRPMFFQTLNHFVPETTFQIHSSILVSDRFNFSNLVTSHQDKMIFGPKHFKNILLIDNSLYGRNINGNNFTSNTVLTTFGDQFISNEVTFTAPMIRSGKIDISDLINGENIEKLFDNFARKSSSSQINSIVQFKAQIDTFSLLVSGLINGHNVERLAHDTVWTNVPNQALSGNYFFKNSLSINGHLFVNRINDRNIPGDLVLTSDINIIRGQKNFINHVSFDHIHITSSLNDLSIQKDELPDIIMKYHSQNITGFKIFENLYVTNHSFVGGLINGVSLSNLDKRIREKPQVRNFDKLFVNNFAQFQDGIHFEHINGLSRLKFERLLHNSISINDPWEKYHFDNLIFHDLYLNTLDVDQINDLNLENHLLCKNLTQTISENYYFRSNVHFSGPSSIESINEVSLSGLDNLFRIFGNQELGTKVFLDDLQIHSLRVRSINSIPFDEIVFLDSLVQRPISGIKTFLSQEFSASEASVQDLITSHINSLSISKLIYGTLREDVPQTLSNLDKSIFVHTIQAGEHFKINHLNDIQLWNLAEDVVFGNISGIFQNISGPKHFVGSVFFENDISFIELFDGVTDWEIRNNWMLQGVSQRVEATFNIDKLVTNDAFVDNDLFNGIEIGWLMRNIARRDQKTVFHGPIHFVGEAVSLDDIDVSSTLNGIRLNEDVLLHDSSAIQTVRGHISIHGPVHIRKNFDLRSRIINEIDINHLCSSLFQNPSTEDSIENNGKQLVVNGNAVILNSLNFKTINNLTLTQMMDDSLRLDVDEQSIYGRRMIKTLVLNGPTFFDSTLNRINLTHLSRFYLSLTRDQIVETEIILNRSQVITGDVDIIHRLSIQNNLIMGVNLAAIEATSLQKYGNQHYIGNIDFTSEVHFKNGFNAKWINAQDTSAFMSRKRQQNTFTSEAIFTESVNVVDNLNIIKRKTICGVDVDRMLHSSVRQNEPSKNFSISGKKVFDNIIVNVIHTEKLNQVKISKRHLLLKSENQILTGKMTFKGDLQINNLLVNEINQLPFNLFSQNLVQKSKPFNTIETKVNFHLVDAEHVKAQGLVDNINISVLNQISETVGFLKKMENSTVHYRSEFESFERKLSAFSSKFMFFEDVQILGTLPDVLLNTLPAVVQRLRGRLIILTHQMNTFSPGMCEQISVNISPKTSLEKRDNTWRMVNFDVPGRVIKINIFGSYLVTIFNPSRATPSSNCFRESREIFQQLASNSTLAIRIDRLFIENKPKTLLDRVAGISSLTHENIMRVDFLHKNLLLLSTNKHCSILCLTCEPDVAVIATIKITFPVVFIALPVTDFQNIFAIIDVNSRLNVYEFDHSFGGGFIKPKLSMFVFNIKSALLVYEPKSLPISNYLLVTYKQTSNYQTANGAHLFGLDFETGRFIKIQELPVYDVERSMAFYHQTKEFVEPYLLLQTRTKIVIYRMFGSGMAESIGILPIDGYLLWWNINSYNELSLFTTSVFRTEEESLSQENQTCSVSKNFGNNISFRLMKPCYRQEVLYGFSVMSNEREHFRREENKSSNALFMNAVIN